MKRVANASTAFTQGLLDVPRTDTPATISAAGSNLTVNIGDPTLMRVDATQAASVTYTVYLEGGQLSTDDERRLRMMLQQQGPEAVASMSRVRSYLDKAQATCVRLPSAVRVL